MAALGCAYPVYSPSPSPQQSEDTRPHVIFKLVTTVPTDVNVSGDQRIEEELQIFDKNGTRIGRARLSPYGTYELFDAQSRRVGEGRPSSITDTIRFFDTDGRPMFEIRKDERFRIPER